MESKIITISRVSEDGNVTLLYDELEKILTQPKIGKRPIVIVSIAGAFREGKSFILNFLIRYLKNKGHENDSWLGDFSSPLKDGFHWRGGKNADTKGINILSEPFIVKKHGEEVAVLLLDTQGLFDEHTEKSVNAQIFALSTLLSSVQIFNLTGEIQENYLEYLEFFVGFATASRDWIKDRKPFQSLLFLVRDWSHSCDNDYGMEGGRMYLRYILDRSKLQDRKSGRYTVREKLHSSFENLQCFLMPHPGKKVSGGQKGYIFKGCINDIDEEFVQQLKPLANLLLNPENLIIKQIDGKQANSQLLLNFVRGCNEAFKSGKLPEVTTMLEVWCSARNMEAFQIAEKCYDSMMQNGLKEYLSDRAFQAFHTSSHDKAVGIFYQNKASGTRGKAQDLEIKLQRRIRELYMEFIKQNLRKKNEAQYTCEMNMERELKSYKMKMKQSLHEPVDAKLLELIHEKYYRNAVSYFNIGTGNRELMSKQLQELQKKLQDIYHEIKKENEEKFRDQEQKKFAKMAEASLSEHADMYQTKMNEVCDGNYITNSALWRMHETVSQETKENFNTTFRQLRSIRSYSQRLRSWINTVFENIRANNEIEKERFIHSLEDKVEKIAHRYKDEMEEVIRWHTIDPDEVSRKMQEPMRKAIQEYRSNCNADHVDKDIVSQYENKLNQKLKAKLEKLADDNRRAYDRKQEENAKKEIYKHVEMYSKEYKHCITPQRYIPEDKLQTTAVQLEYELKVLFKRECDRLGLNLSKFQDALEVKMQADFQTAILENRKLQKIDENNMRKLMENSLITTTLQLRISEIDERARCNAMEKFKEKRDNSNYFGVKYESEIIDAMDKRFKKIEERNNKTLAHLAKEKEVHEETVNAFALYLVLMGSKGFATADELKASHIANKREVIMFYRDTVIRINASPAMYELHETNLEQLMENDFAQRIH